MTVEELAEEAIKKLGKDMVAEIIKQRKHIDSLDIAKQKLDLGSIPFLLPTPQPRMGYNHIPTRYMLPIGGTYQVQHGNNKNTITLPEGTQLNLWDWNKVADEIASVNEDMSCKHEWVNVGFHFDKWVCKKCDVNKGSNE